MVRRRTRSIDLGGRRNKTQIWKSKTRTEMHEQIDGCNVRTGRSERGRMETRIWAQECEELCEWKEQWWWQSRWKE